MDLPVILSKLEQEYLLAAIEAALPVGHPRDWFLWAQGQLQALLPHQALVCLRLDGDGHVHGLQCVHGAVLPPAALAWLAGESAMHGPPARQAGAVPATGSGRAAHGLPEPRGARTGPAAQAWHGYGAEGAGSAAGAVCGAEWGLAGQLARLWQQGAVRPAILEAGPAPDAAPGRLAPLLLALQAARRECGDVFANVLVHGSGAAAGGTFFALFGMPFRPGPRHAYFLELLMPHMHLALLRMASAMPAIAGGAAAATVAGSPHVAQAGAAGLDAPGSSGGAISALIPGAMPGAIPAARPLSRRELEILHWVREGKNNEEIGRILGLSAWTVKNHLQRLYKAMGVGNRAQAVARGIALRLLAPAGNRQPH